MEKEKCLDLKKILAKHLDKNYEQKHLNQGLTSVKKKMAKVSSSYRSIIEIQDILTKVYEKITKKS